MINSIKRCRKIEKDEGRDFFVFGIDEKVIMDSEEGGFCGVVFAKGRLEGRDGGKGDEVGSQLVGKDSFE